MKRREGSLDHRGTKEKEMPIQRAERLMRRRKGANVIPAIFQSSTQSGLKGHWTYFEIDLTV